MEEELRKQIALLEQIIELQNKLLAAKGMAYPVYVPYWSYPDPWYPWKPHGPVGTGDKVCIPSVWTGSSTKTETEFTTTYSSTEQ